MKITSFFLAFSCLFFLVGCRDSAHEQRLAQQEAALKQREHDLQQREADLALREQHVARIKQQLDSTRQAAPVADTALVRALPGVWDTRMSCTETACPGSAIGDSKNEQWELSFAHDSVLVLARANNKVVRRYAGRVVGSTLLLRERRAPTAPPAEALITAQLQLAGPQRLEGRREIDKAAPDNCRIVYDLVLTRPGTRTPISIR